MVDDYERTDPVYRRLESIHSVLERFKRFQRGSVRCVPLVPVEHFLCHRVTTAPPEHNALELVSDVFLEAFVCVEHIVEDADAQSVDAL